MRISSATWGCLLVLIFVCFILAISIIDYRQIQKAAREGKLIEANIVNRHAGTQRITIRYQHQNAVFKKNLKVSLEVWNKLEDKDQIEIKVLDKDPTILTWEGDRRPISLPFGWIGLVFVILLTFIAILVSISEKPK